MNVSTPGGFAAVAGGPARPLGTNRGFALGAAGGTAEGVAERSVGEATGVASDGASGKGTCGAAWGATGKATGGATVADGCGVPGAPVAELLAALGALAEGGAQG